MSIWSLIILSMGLGSDAFAVSISNGLYYQDYSKKQIIKTAIIFAIFQGAMPLVGYFGGKLFEKYLISIDHWVSLILLGAIGLKMIYDAIVNMKKTTSEIEELHGRIDQKTLLMQAIAISIDAIAVGISFVALKVNVFYACAMITLITFIMCIIGGFIGKKFGKSFTTIASIIGGLLLIIIGVGIFFEHTM